MRRCIPILAGAMLAAGSLVTQVARAVCTFGPSSEPSLQSVFDTSLLGPGVLSATGDCLNEGSDGVWTTQNLAGATILLELAGNASTNSFGVYDIDTPASGLTVFSGSASAGEDAYLMVNQIGGSWYLSVLGSSSGTINLGSNPVFGFYLNTMYGTFRSVSADSVDGVDHMYAYQGTNTFFIGGPSAGTPFTTNSYILAWEDLPATHAGYDADFQDFLVQVVNVSPLPVPLPSAIWMLATGLIGLAGVSRRIA